jgi:hypothetical protein
MVHIMTPAAFAGVIDEICMCNHPRDDHVTVHIKPGGVNGKTTGQTLICRLCLCHSFEPKEGTEKAKLEEPTS